MLDKRIFLELVDYVSEDSEEVLNSHIADGMPEAGAAIAIEGRKQALDLLKLISLGNADLEAVETYEKFVDVLIKQLYIAHDFGYTYIQSNWGSFDDIHDDIIAAEEE